MRSLLAFSLTLVIAVPLTLSAQRNNNPRDGRNQQTGKAAPVKAPALKRFGIYKNTTPRPAKGEPVATPQPLTFEKGDRVALIGNTLLDRTRLFGRIETMLHQTFPEQELVVRNFAWPGDTPSLQPRPSNFADLLQHLHYEKVDVVIAAFGFNESFAGEAGTEDFRKELSDFVLRLQTSKLNGESTPRIVLLSPTANEDTAAVKAGSMNNDNLELYTGVIRKVAAERKAAFVNLFEPTARAMVSEGSDLTINGVHLTDAGYGVVAEAICMQLFERLCPQIDERLRDAVVDKNRQYYRRFRPLNTFYYTGDRNGPYGYLDFLPAMRNFEIMTENRDAYIHQLAKGEPVPEVVDDSNLPEMPETAQSRGANEWLSPEDERQAFKMDDRFDVTLFASEAEFPEIAAPVQMRWDSQGRLWVSTSTTYPHVYPGHEPEDKLVVLEDVDHDGKADTCTTFAEGLHVPLSFEFGDGGVYVSEQPDLTFLKDTDGDGKADERTVLLTGFGTEDSHHSLHDFTWTPDGDLIFRESIFHHSQVETPYGPVRQQNSGWFRFEPATHKLTSFGTYHSTNPWGVTFDEWGQHLASHPIYAEAFHSLDPPYPTQHPKPVGLQAYSGVCGHEFIDWDTFPEDLQGMMLKVRYKPTNRVELLKWKRTPFGFSEEYVSDALFSTNLSFIPVDCRFGPDGSFYVCDWYNPIKGHAQYSLRDERRDRQSGRIWRITPKGSQPAQPIDYTSLTVEELVDLLQRREYRIRYWAKRELRERDPRQVSEAVRELAANLKPVSDRLRQTQLEVLWVLRSLDETDADLLRELLACDEPLARSQAVKQLRYLHAELDDAIALLSKAATDPDAIVRMQTAIACSWIGTRDAYDVLLTIFDRPMGGHLAYAVQCAIGSEAMVKHWKGEDEKKVTKLLAGLKRSSRIKEPNPTAQESQFDSQADLRTVRIGCVPERMKFTVEQFSVRPGQPVKIVFTNPDATDHNLLVVQPGKLADVGIAANRMAKDPKNANSDFIPKSEEQHILHASPMIGPTRKRQVHVLRFEAPAEPGVYPYVCTFPGHWVVMNGRIVVASTDEQAEELLAASGPQFVRKWALTDFAENVVVQTDDETVLRGMQSFMQAQCHQCHQVHGHGVALGPDLTKLDDKLKGRLLLEQLIAPSSKIDKKYQMEQFLMIDGRVVAGVVKSEDEKVVRIVRNLLAPNAITTLKKSAIEERFPSKVSPMPTGLLDRLTRPQIMDLLGFLEAKGGKPHMHAAEGKTPDVCGPEE